MPWVRIDDHFDEHPKLASVGPLGWALWLAGLAYCNRNLTDGFIPWAVAPTLVPWDFLDGDNPTRIYIGSFEYVSEEQNVTGEYVLSLLLGSGVWDKTKGGYQVHDYANYQPTKEAVLAERAVKVAAGRAGGIATAAARAVAKVRPVPVPVPVPNTVPVPNPKNALRSAREKRTGGLERIDTILPRTLL